MTTTPTPPFTSGGWSNFKSGVDGMQVNRPVRIASVKLSDGSTDPVTGEYNITEDLGDVIAVNINGGGMVVLPLASARFIPFGEIVGIGATEKL